MTTESRSSNLITHLNSGIHNDEIPDPTGKLIQWFNMPMPQSAAASFDQPNESFEERLIGDSLDLQSQQSCPPFGFEYNFTSSTQIASAFNPVQSNTERLIGSEKWKSSARGLSANDPTTLLFTEGFFITSPFVMSRVLTTFGDYSNPMNSIVIPLALADQTLMQILLSLSCSHLLKLQPTGMSPELSAERNRLHQKALQTQTQRIQALKRTAVSIGSQSSSTDSDTIFVTSLLFCLYEICEGTGGNGCDAICKWHESSSASPLQQQ
ncbi:hypothetical protein V8E51_008279 [Hyaloscypha variabilis]